MLYIIKDNVPEHICDTLEPAWRDLRHGEAKVKGETAIPEGRYRIGFDASPSFKRTMPYLLSVPYFSGIMIHPGNSAEDTKGCILVGKRLNVGQIVESRNTFNSLFAQMMQVAPEEAITITVL